MFDPILIIKYPRSMLVVATQRKGRDKASDFSRQVERALSGKISGKAAKGMQISQIRQSPCKNLPSSQVWKLLHWTLHKASKKKKMSIVSVSTAMLILFLQVFLLQLEAGRNFETFIVEYLRPRALFKLCCCWN